MIYGQAQWKIQRISTLAFRFVCAWHSQALAWKRFLWEEWISFEKGTSYQLTIKNNWAKKYWSWLLFLAAYYLLIKDLWYICLHLKFSYNLLEIISIILLHCLLLLWINYVFVVELIFFLIHIHCIYVLKRFPHNHYFFFWLFWVASLSLLFKLFFDSFLKSLTCFSFELIQLLNIGAKLFQFGSMLLQPKFLYGMRSTTRAVSRCSALIVFLLASSQTLLARSDTLLTNSKWP